MSNKKLVNYSIIFKRSSCLNSSILESNIVNSEKRYKNLKTQLESATDGNINPSVLNSLRSFMESLSNTANANKYFRQPLYLIEQFNSINENISNKIITDYNSRVLPYVENLSDISETLDRYNLYDSQKEKITECANILNAADRILANHDRISKRFNIESEILKIKSKGLKWVTESCCELVDTYTIKPYQKMNICIEELSYLFEKNNINYDTSDMVAYIVEFFLLNNKTTNEELNNYKLALSESYCITEDDLDKVDYLYNNSKRVTIDNEIGNFLKSPNKSRQMIDDIMDKCFENCTKLDIVNNFYKFAWLLWNVQKSNICDSGENFIEDTNCSFDKLVRFISDNINKSDENDDNYSFTKEDINKLINYLSDTKTIIISVYNDPYEYMILTCQFKGAIDKLIKKINYLKNLIYPKYNFGVVASLNNNNIKESCETITINEFKLFKFNNIIKASMNLDKYLKIKSKKLIDNGNKKLKKMFKKVKNILFENYDVYSYIGEDSKFDICVAQYYYDESCLSEIHDFFNNICKDFNFKLVIEGLNNVKSYYIINPGILEVHLKDNTPIQLEENDLKMVRESFNPSFEVYIEELALMNSIMNSNRTIYSDNCMESIKEKVFNFINTDNLQFEHYEVAMEAMSLLNVSKEDVDLFTERFTDYRYNKIVNENNGSKSLVYDPECKKIDEVYNNWKHEENVPLYIQWEAYQILSVVLEDAPKVEKPKLQLPKHDSSNNDEKDKDDKKDSNDEEFKKNPFKGININSIKLYLEGLKSKMKDMGQKEKEISKNLDNDFRRFVKSMKDALVSDRREAIIKGSVIPSFSRCIKFGIGLAGVGFLSGNPLVPIIIAIGGFATSKKLTKKERLLLLDEIDTELEVVEKEIQMAESKNQLKKYRTLLKYKKDLQRQYQRIRYNVRVGKDLLPDSASGVKAGNND